MDQAPTSPKQSKPRPPPAYLQQAIAYVAEGRGELVPVFYLHYMAGLINGALRRRRPRVA